MTPTAVARIAIRHPNPTLAQCYERAGIPEEQS